MYFWQDTIDISHSIAWVSIVVSCHTSNVNKLHYLSIIIRLKDGARSNSNQWPYADINHCTHINQLDEDVLDGEINVKQILAFWHK